MLYMLLYGLFIFFVVEIISSLLKDWRFDLGLFAVVAISLWFIVSLLSVL